MKVGLSPHIRGNPSITSAPVQREGSIPAHTGEPKSDMSLKVKVRVYPRTYGGTRREPAKESICGGLSPHIRGNPFVDIPFGKEAGSIPAHTGEPFQFLQ